MEEPVGTWRGDCSPQEEKAPSSGVAELTGQAGEECRTVGSAGWWALLRLLPFLSFFLHPDAEPEGDAAAMHLDPLPMPLMAAREGREARPH